MCTVRTNRESYKQFTANGILFNHESEIRSLEFVTKKIYRSVATWSPCFYHHDTLSSASMMTFRFLVLSSSAILSLASLTTCSFSSSRITLSGDYFSIRPDEIVPQWGPSLLWAIWRVWTACLWLLIPSLLTWWKFQIGLQCEECLLYAVQIVVYGKAFHWCVTASVHKKESSHIVLCSGDGIVTCPYCYLPILQVKYLRYVDAIDSMVPLTFDLACSFSTADLFSASFLWKCDLSSLSPWDHGRTIPWGPDRASLIWIYTAYGI